MCTHAVIWVPLRWRERRAWICKKISRKVLWVSFVSLTINLSCESNSRNSEIESKRCMKWYLYAVIFRTLSCPSESSSCLDAFSASKMAYMHTTPSISGPLWLITATAKGLTQSPSSCWLDSFLPTSIVHLYSPLTICFIRKRLKNGMEARAYEK